MKKASQHKFLKNKVVQSILVFLIVVLLLFLMRTPILRGVYNFLDVSQYPDMKFEYGIVLGGEPLDRSTAAAELYKDNKLEKIICTGAHIPPEFAAIGLSYTEAQASQQRLISLGIPEEDIILLEEATSTKEEVDAINQLFKDQDRHSLLIITTQSHTRRALRIFRKYTDDWEEIMAYGTNPSRYDSDYWWKNEFGILAVFQEYLKTVFYWITY